MRKKKNFIHFISKAIPLGAAKVGYYCDIVIEISESKYMEMCFEQKL